MLTNSVSLEGLGSAVDNACIVDDSFWAKLFPSFDGATLSPRCLGPRHPKTARHDVVVDSLVRLRRHFQYRPSKPLCYPIIHCLPVSDSADQLTALVLNVGQAHRRIVILPFHRGLLCVRH